MTRLTGLHIHDFRGLADVELELSSFGVLLGRNNAGKSSVLDAVRVLLGDRTWTDEDRPLTRPGSTCRIHANLDDGSWIRLEVDQDGEKHWEDSHGATGKSPVGVARSAHVTYVPPDVRVGDLVKATKSSPLTELLSDALAGPEGDELRATVKQLEAAIHEDPAVTALVERLNARLAAWDVNLTAAFEAPDPAHLVASMLELRATDGDAEVDVAGQGAGVQRSIAFALIDAVASGQDTDDGDLRMLLFEEPEVYLHPSQIAALHRRLIDLSGDGGYQTLVTTHSAEFLSEGFERLDRVARIVPQDGGAVARQLRQRDVTELVHGPTAPEPKELLVALDTMVRRGRALFAEHVLVVEGPTEEHLLPALERRGLLRLPPDTHVVRADGKGSIPAVIRVLGAYGLRGAVIYDGDTGKAAAEVEDQAIEEAAAELGWRTLRFEHDLEGRLGYEPAKPKHVTALMKLTDDELDRERLASFCRDVETLFDEEQL